MVISRLLLGTLLLLFLSESGADAYLFGRGGGKSPPPPPPEEFIGPFPSWMDVTQTAANGGCTSNSSSGADNTGATDATTALQNCINSLTSTKPVMYFPAGTYKISSTLVMPGNGQTCLTNPSAGLHYIMLIGADPATTTIQWAGASGGTMMCLDGVNYASISRLTFDANASTSANVIIQQAFFGGQYADTPNEYSDLVLKNAGASTGIGFAFLCGGLQCSETTLLRDQFTNNVVGLQTIDQNALDNWCWWCKFQGNHFAMSAAGTPHSVPGSPCGSNDCSGSFAAFNSVFLNSTNEDITFGNNGVGWDFINNYSSGSGYFINGGGVDAFDAIVLKGNTIANAVSCAPFVDGNPGPGLFVGNTVITSPSCTTYSLFSLTSTASAGPSFVFAGGGDALAKDNVVNKSGNSGNNCANSGGSVTSPLYTRLGRCHEWSESLGATDPGAPTLPTAPPKTSRTVYEASPSGPNNGSGLSCPASNPCSIQTAVCLAATGSNGFSSGNCTGTVAASRSVVHLIPGTYTQTATLSIPANADIQIIGDGPNTQVQESGLSSSPTIRITGPSHVVMRHFWVSGGGTSSAVDALEITSIDQSGAVIYGDQTSFISTAQRGLFSDTALSNVLEEFHNSSVQIFNDANVLVAGANKLNWFASVSITGGPVNGGFELTGSGNMLITGNWNDGGSTLMDKVSGGGTFTHLCCHTGLTTGTPNGATFTGFTGNAVIGAMDYQNSTFSQAILGIDTASPGNVLGWGIGDPVAPYWSTSGTGTAPLLNSVSFVSGQGYTPATVTDTSFTQSQVNAAMAQFEAANPAAPALGATGVTAIQLHNIGLLNARYDLWIH